VSTQADSRGLPWQWVLVRDIGLFAVGAIAFFLEMQRAEVRDSVLTLIGVLLGSPVGAAGLASLADALRSRGGTSRPSSSSPEDPPPQSVSP
jgi:hypothetical protein